MEIIKGGEKKMFKCPRCGRVLKRLEKDDEFADFMCPNNWCDSYYTYEFLEDEKEKNDGEEE